MQFIGLNDIHIIVIGCQFCYEF